MVPEEFDYYVATTVREALDLLAEHGPDADLLAGGHSLLPAMKRGDASPAAVIDIAAIDALQGVELTDDSDTLVVGAMTRYADLLAEPMAHKHAPTVTATVRELGDRQVRNRGTVGGNLVAAESAADLPGAAIAADATLVAVGPDGERAIPIDEFFRGRATTALADDELLARVEFSAEPDAVGTYAKKVSPASGYAMVGVAVRLTVEDDTVRSAGVGASGLLDRGVRLSGVEDELTGATLDADTVEAAAARATEEIERDRVRSNQEASAAFRERLLEVYTERALREVASEATPVATDGGVVQS